MPVSYCWYDLELTLKIALWDLGWDLEAIHCCSPDFAKMVRSIAESRSLCYLHLVSQRVETNPHAGKSATHSTFKATHLAGYTEQFGYWERNWSWTDSTFMQNACKLASIYSISGWLNTLVNKIRTCASSSCFKLKANSIYLPQTRGGTLHRNSHLQGIQLLAGSFSLSLRRVGFLVCSCFWFAADVKGAGGLLSHY